ncbi:hypothetical protein MRBLBA71_001431 [Bacillus nitratireducens]|uniref:hypothetical protein n=1 Tax=Bacillus nitratireducens TaxID=2026193 RepID=UPI0034658C79
MDKKYLVTVTPVQEDSKPQKNNSLSAADRKNIKVSPKSFSKIKAICTMKGMKNYEFIDEMLDFYIANNLNDREQYTLDDIISGSK